MTVEKRVLNGNARVIGFQAENIHLDVAELGWVPIGWAVRIPKRGRGEIWAVIDHQEAEISPQSLTMLVEYNQDINAVPKVSALYVGVYDDEDKTWLGQGFLPDIGDEAEVVPANKIPPGVNLGYITLLRSDQSRRAHLSSLLSQPREDSGNIVRYVMTHHWGLLSHIASLPGAVVGDEWYVRGVNGRIVQTLRFGDNIGPNMARIYVIRVTPGNKKREWKKASIFALPKEVHIALPEQAQFAPNLREIGRIVPWAVEMEPLGMRYDDNPQAEETVGLLPPLQAKVEEASEEDIRVLFPGDVFVGRYLDGKSRIHLPSEALFESHAGVFGKTGTGKSTFLRILLEGVLSKTTKSRRQVRALVLDFHNEFGMSWEARDGTLLHGLRDTVPNTVIVGIGEDVFKAPNGVTGRADTTLTLPLWLVKPHHLEQLKNTLGLSEKGGLTLSTVRKIWETNPLMVPSEEEMEKGRQSVRMQEIAPTFLHLFKDWETNPYVSRWVKESPGINMASFAAVARVISRIFWDENGNLLPYWAVKSGKSFNVVMNYLREGKHVVVLNFPRDHGQRALLSTVLLSSLLEAWENWKTEGSRGHLWIVADEAHNFIPRDTRIPVFNQLARESRKFGVTMLVSTQTPQQLYGEVLAQIGVVFAFKLDGTAINTLSSQMSASVTSAMWDNLKGSRQFILFGRSVLVPVLVFPPDYKELHTTNEKREEKKQSDSNIMAAAFDF